MIDSFLLIVSTLVVKQHERESKKKFIKYYLIWPKWNWNNESLICFEAFYLKCVFKWVIGRLQHNQTHAHSQRKVM